MLIRKPVCETISLLGRSRRIAAIVRVLLAASAVTCFSFAGHAQEEAGATVWTGGGCSDCHGNLAAGGTDPAYPRGPNLRRTQLNHDQLVETISCGRPGTQMPTNLSGAYTQTPCYGLPVGPVPPEVRGKGALTAAQIGALVDFLLKDVVGKTKITRQNCALFNDGNMDAPECQQY